MQIRFFSLTLLSDWAHRALLLFSLKWIKEFVLMQDLLVHLFIHDLMTFVSIVFVPACPVLSPFFLIWALMTIKYWWECGLVIISYPLECNLSSQVKLLWLCCIYSLQLHLTGKKHQNLLLCICIQTVLVCTNSKWGIFWLVLSKMFWYLWQYLITWSFLRKIKYIFEYQAIRQTYHWNLAAGAAFEASWQSCARELRAGCIEVSVNTPPPRQIRSSL